VRKEWQSRECRRLLASMLRGRRREDSTELADEGARGPQAAGRVEEGRDGGGRTAVTRGHSEEEAVVLGEVLRRDLGVVGARGGVHLAADFVLRALSAVSGRTGAHHRRTGTYRERSLETHAEDLGDLEEVDLGAVSASLLGDRLGEGANVTVCRGSEESAVEVCTVWEMGARGRAAHRSSTARCWTKRGGGGGKGESARGA